MSNKIDNNFNFSPDERHAILRVDGPEGVGTVALEEITEPTKHVARLVIDNYKDGVPCDALCGAIFYPEKPLMWFDQQFTKISDDKQYRELFGVADSET